MFAHFDLLAVGVLVAGDLDEGLGLGDALLLHIDPAELLGDGLQHPAALDGGVVVAVVVVAVAGDDCGQGEDEEEPGGGHGELGTLIGPDPSRYCALIG